MFELPDMEDVEEIVVNDATINDNKPPKVVKAKKGAGKGKKEKVAS